MAVELYPLVLESPGALHREMPWISLPTSAELPRPGLAIREGERRRLLQDLLECERTRQAAETSLLRRAVHGGIDVEIGPREVRDAWRKFFLSHSAFFHVFGLLADLYRRCAMTLEQGGWPLREIEQACALWRLAGALMLYGVDFSPTETIYQQYIRPHMPEAFSGTWLREYILVTVQRRRFNRALDGRLEDHRDQVGYLRTELSRSEKCYHQFHFQVMLACVPDLTSKLQAYQLEHGDFKLTERHFETYDRWFHVLRQDLDLASYARSTCAVFSELLTDLAAGTLLEPAPLAELTAGTAVVLELVRSAVCEEPVH
jgi:hypothetical protein